MNLKRKELECETEFDKVCNDKKNGYKGNLFTKNDILTNLRWSKAFSTSKPKNIYFSCQIK
jgi:hypothetical protein